MGKREQIIEEMLNDFQKMRRSLISKGHHPGKMLITPAQGQVLHLVKQKEGIGVTEIAEALDISKSATTQLIDALVKSDLLVRESSSEDRRALHLKLSEKSKKHQLAMRKQIAQSITNLMSILSDDELEQYYELNRKIVEGIAKKE